MAKRRRRRGAGPVLPEELVVWEILVRLPAKPLLRCCAVCRSWRRRTSEAAFLIAHHRRQPSLPLVLFHGDLPLLADRRVFVDASLDALDLRRPPSERRRVLRFNDYNYFRDLQRPRLLPRAAPAPALQPPLLPLQPGHAPVDRASSAHRRRQRRRPVPARLVRLRRSVPRPLLDGEIPWSLHLKVVYHVLTMGSTAAPRRVKAASPSAKSFVGSGDTSQSPAILLHGCLHRILHSSQEKVLAVFDTVAESFRTMRSPIAGAAAAGWERPRLLEMDAALAVSCVDTSQTMMKLWVLQDYEAESWTLKRRVIFPLVDIRGIVTKDCNYRFYETVASEDGDVLLHRPGSVHLFHCDNRGDLLQNFSRSRVFPRPVGHCFRESLVRHEFFERQPGAPRVRRLPRFFRGL